MLHDIAACNVSLTAKPDHVRATLAAQPWSCCVKACWCHRHTSSISSALQARLLAASGRQNCQHAAMGRAPYLKRCPSLTQCICSRFALTGSIPVASRGSKLPSKHSRCVCVDRCLPPAILCSGDAGTQPKSVSPAAGCSHQLCSRVGQGSSPAAVYFVGPCPAYLLGRLPCAGVTCAAMLCMCPCLQQFVGRADHKLGSVCLTSMHQLTSAARP